MSKIQKSKLSWKLTRIVVLVALVIGIGLNLLQISRDFVNEEKRAERILEQVIQSILPAAVEVAYKLDSEGAEEIVNGLLNYYFIENVEIIDDSLTVLAEGSTRYYKESSTLWITKRLFSEFVEKRVNLIRQENNYSYGVLILKASNDRIYSELYKRSLGVFIIGLARNLFLSFVLLAIFYYLLTKPLTRIAASFTSIHPENNPAARLPQIRGHKDDEMGEIVARANSYIDSSAKFLEQIQSAKREIEARKQYLQNILTTAAEGFLRIDEQNIICDTNPSIENILGLSRDQLLGKDIYTIIAQKDSELLKYQHSKRREGQQSTYLLSFVDSESQEIPCLVSATPNYNEAQQYIGAFAFITDVRETIAAEKDKKRLEAELYQARKMESIGTLAGGIAHDFNNLLAAVMGYTELALDGTDKGSPIRPDLEEVLIAAKRGKQLVQQILDFSRQSESVAILVDAKIMLDEAIKILRPTLPANIEIIREIEDTAGYIFVDPVKFQQVILNLSTNAYHAMEEKGGQLTISSQCVIVRENTVSSILQKNKATHIRITIRDTGSGIVAEIRDRIFDPFFTTKEIGKGTGMGLAIIHGIVEDSGGWVKVESEVGVGSAFHIFLPLNEKREEDRSERVDYGYQGSERVLLVDDEQPIADSCKRYLQKNGYQVTMSTSSFEALSLFRDNPDNYDVVITDYTMPGLTGIDLARRILEVKGDIPIIIMTGFSAAISGDVLRQTGIKGFALKPMVNREMGALLRNVLNGQTILP